MFLCTFISTLVCFIKPVRLFSTFEEPAQDYVNGYTATTEVMSEDLEEIDNKPTESTK